MLSYSSTLTTVPSRTPAIAMDGRRRRAEKASTMMRMRNHTLTPKGCGCRITRVSSAATGAGDDDSRSSCEMRKNNAVGDVGRSRCLPRQACHLAGICIVAVGSGGRPPEHTYRKRLRSSVDVVDWCSRAYRQNVGHGVAFKKEDFDKHRRRRAS